MTLYELTKEQQFLYDLIASGQAVDEETGEVDGTVIEQIEIKKKDIDKKIEGTAIFIKQLEADAEALKQEKLRLEKRQKTLVNTAERLRKNLLRNMVAQGKSRFSTTKAGINIRDDEYVNIYDEKKIPEQYIRVKKEISKVDIKNAIKAGQEVAGAEIATRKNIMIK